MRYLTPHLLKDLQKKMVFIAGPRQCGKTTLAQSIMTQFENPLYLNWDDVEHRDLILKRQWSDNNQLLVFDELHKYSRWKNWLKGLYDTQKNKHKILVTGSARLDIYKKGGDSMLGRYHLWRLHPFTLDERPEAFSKEEAFNRLMKVGGFPEPFFDGDETEARRWRLSRFNKIFTQDIRDLENIRNLQLMEVLIERLKSRVGSMVVLDNLANELKVAHKTVGAWLAVCERMYLIFTIYPLATSARSIQKPPKIYFFDNADVIGDEGSRFENLVATHLLKRLNFLTDSTGYKYELRYIRDKEKREVDFAILKDGKLEEIIEAKWADDQISPHLSYYTKKLNPSKITQVVGQIKNPYTKDNINVISATDYFSDSPRSHL